MPRPSPAPLGQRRNHADRPARTELHPVEQGDAEAPDLEGTTGPEGRRGTVLVEGIYASPAVQVQTPRALAIVQLQVAVAGAAGRQAGEDCAVRTHEGES